jgi:acyl-coenzyme A thioesterase PaaI-like protein
VITALLDETIGRAINVGEPDTWGVTMEFTTKFRRPVPLDEEIKVIGRITNNTGRVFEGTGEIVLADGTIAAEGRGRYLKMALSAIADESFADDQWFTDERPVPSEVDI